MQPEEGNNYWQEGSSSDEINETYTPNNEELSEPQTGINPEINNANRDPKEDIPVHWSANEYIHEEKNGIWFTLFALTVIGLISVDIFIFKSITFSILVIVMAVAVIIFARRPPKMIDYTLSGDQGLYIGEKLYHFSEFKSFGIIKDRDQHSIMLIPTKRLSPGVSVYFPEEAGEEIVDILGARLPMESLKLDFVDLIVRKLRL